MKWRKSIWAFVHRLVHKGRLHGRERGGIRAVNKTKKSVGAHIYEGNDFRKFNTFKLLQSNLKSSSTFLNLTVSPCL